MARPRRRGVLVRPRERGAWRRPALRALNAAVLAAVLGALGYGLHVLRDPARFPLRQVQIAGNLDRVDRAALTAALVPVSRGGFFTVDVDGVGAAAREVAWVDRAQVRRVWPDRLVIEITQQQAAARWAPGGLVNVRGERFAAPDAGTEDLPLLAGPEGSAAQVLDRYRRFAQVLDPVGELDAAALDARGTWRLTLADATVITVRDEDADARLARFARLYSTRMAGRVPPLASVDLRYADGFAVRHRTPAKTDPPPTASMARL